MLIRDNDFHTKFRRFLFTAVSREAPTIKRSVQRTWIFFVNHDLDIWNALDESDGCNNSAEAGSNYATDLSICLTQNIQNYILITTFNGRASPIGCSAIAEEVPLPA